MVLGPMYNIGSLGKIKRQGIRFCNDCTITRNKFQSEESLEDTMSVFHDFAKRPYFKKPEIVYDAIILQESFFSKPKENDWLSCIAYGQIFLYPRPVYKPYGLGKC